jgi:hypothetical protein
MESPPNSRKLFNIFNEETKNLEKRDEISYEEHTPSCLLSIRLFGSVGDVAHDKAVA